MNESERLIQCPHCQQFIIILELNCKIFRHGTYKESGEQIPPHSPKEICDALIESDQIYGCGKPFKIVILETGEWKIEICDYI